MTTRRRQETADAEAATRRLAGLTGRGVATADPGPPDDPEGFDWFFPAPPPRPDVAPSSTPWPPEDDASGGLPGARSGAAHGVPGAPASAGPGGWPPGEPGAPRRPLLGRLPEVVRAAGVPVNAALAVVLVVVAVVAGVLLRSGGGSGVVDVGPASGGRASAAARPAGSAGAMVGAGAGAGAGAAVGAPSAGAPRLGGAGELPGLTVGAAAVTSPPVGVVVVDVVGKVRRPGLVRLPTGSRVADAVAAAGGPTDAAALPRINLARVLADGEQVVVPDADDPLPPVAAAGAPGGAPSGGAARSGPLDLNAATASDLDGLPGIGPVIAGRIVSWRTEHQRFTRVDELAEVPGIGDRLLERLRPLVTV